MTDQPKISYNLAEAAVACGVSEQTIRRAAKKHELLGKRTGANGGGRFVFTRAELEAWLESLEDA